MHASHIVIRQFWMRRSVPGHDTRNLHVRVCVCVCVCGHDTRNLRPRPIPTLLLVDTLTAHDIGVIVIPGCM